jgi:hypothetical protein
MQREDEQKPVEQPAYRFHTGTKHLGGDDNNEHQSGCQQGRDPEFQTKQKPDKAHRGYWPDHILLLSGRPKEVSLRE